MPLLLSDGIHCGSHGLHVRAECVTRRQAAASGDSNMGCPQHHIGSHPETPGRAGFAVKLIEEVRGGNAALSTIFEHSSNMSLALPRTWLDPMQYLVHQRKGVGRSAPRTLCYIRLKRQACYMPPVENLSFSNTPCSELRGLYWHRPIL